MQWLVRRKPLIAVAAALVLATAGVVVQGRQQPAPEGAREQSKTAIPPADAAVPQVEANRDLARKQLDLSNSALVALHQLARNSRVSMSDPRFALWERRRVEALRKAGAGKAEIVAALEKEIDSLKQAEESAKAQHQAARGTLLDVIDVQFRRMEVESWLNDEKAR